MNVIPLRSLGRKHGTDKGDEHHTHDGMSYLDRYDAHFKPWTERSFNFLEIGVLQGKSLDMWHDYFPNATIWGIDCNPSALEAPCVKWGAKIRIGSQGDPEFMDNVAREAGSFGIVIDDGSHIADHMRLSFERLWHSMLPEGWYVIEDLLMTHNSEWSATQKTFGRDPDDIVGELPKQSRDPVHHLMHWGASQLDHRKDVAEMHHYSMLLMFKRSKGQ